MKWILNLTGRQLWAVVLLCLFVISLTLAGVAQALAMRNFLDFAAAGDKAGFLRWFGVYFGLIFFQLLGGGIRNLLQQSISNRIHNRVRLRFFRTVLTREFAMLRDKKSGDLMQLISSDTSIVVSSVLGLPMEVCGLLTQVIGASICLTYLQGKLALLLLICFAVMLQQITAEFPWMLPQKWKMYLWSPLNPIILQKLWISRLHTYPDSLQINMM